MLLSYLYTCRTSHWLKWPFCLRQEMIPKAMADVRHCRPLTMVAVGIILLSSRNAAICSDQPVLNAGRPRILACGKPTHESGLGKMRILHVILFSSTPFTVALWVSKRRFGFVYHSEGKDGGLFIRVSMSLNFHLLGKTWLWKRPVEKPRGMVDT